MNFRTEIDIAPYDFTIDHRSRGFAIGSCFAAHMAGRLIAAKFPVAENPFGVVYNPLSVAGTVGRLMSGAPFTREELSVDGDLWFNYECHGAFASTDPEEALERMNQALLHGREALLHADYMLVTLGTAWVYDLRAEGRVVANCHKRPASEFIRRRLSIGEVTEALGSFTEGVFEDKKIILTVSPVRHLKDGLAENNLSKSILRVAVAEAIERYPHVYYFPAYEILNDDLRDYRFYAEDMIHPTPLAVDYVWEKFRRAALSEETRLLVKKITEITAAAAHRPFHVGSEAHRKFLRTQRGRVAELMREHPEIDLREELNYFSR